MNAKATGATRSYNMTEISSEKQKNPLFDILKITIAYGFVGFATLIVLYIVTMIFWSTAGNILYSVGYIQTCILVLFVQFSAGFIASIAICRKYDMENPDAGKPGGEPGSKHEKFKNYGLLAGFFTGFFIFMLPTAFVLLVSFGSSGLLHSLTNIFNNFFMFVITGIIGGAAGSYYAGSLIKKGFPGGDDPGKALQEKYVCFALTALLIVFVPLFFGLVAAHLHEPEVIKYGEYDSNNLVLMKIDQYGNITWETDPVVTNNADPGIVLEMKNGSYALFRYESSTHGGLNTLSYISEDGTVSDPVPFLRSDGGISSPVETPTGFMVTYYGKNILGLDYKGNITGQYSIPGPNSRKWYYIEMVPADGNRTLLNWDENYGFMDTDGNISDIGSFSDKEYCNPLYRMSINGMTRAYDGGYIICVKDTESGEMKAVWLDDNLNPVKEEVIGTSHATYISVESSADGEIILIRDVDRPENNPADYKKYFRIYYPGSGIYHDVMTGDSYPEIFVNGDSGYTLFSVREKGLSVEREIIMEICDFDEECSDSINLLEGEIREVKIMQTSDGGYLIAYITGDDEE